jgi:beta-galactosidase
MHPTAEDNIYFTVKGAGKILAVGNSNPLSEESYVGNQRKVYRGRALVVVKSTDEAGDIRLTAQADGLDGAEILIKTGSPVIHGKEPNHEGHKVHKGRKEP